MKDATTETRPFVGWCWPCLGHTLHEPDGACTRCERREDAARAYNVTQEMLYGPRNDSGFTTGLVLGVLLMLLAVAVFLVPALLS